jgi:hypothetical protein
MALGCAYFWKARRATRLFLIHRISNIPSTPLRRNPMRPTLVCLFALLFLGPAFGQQTPPPLQPPAPLVVQVPAPIQNAAKPAAPPRPKLSPTETLRTTRRFFIRSNTFFVKAVDVEASLSKRKEFQEWNLEVTTDALSADAVIEVDRIQFTTDFPFRVTNQEFETVIAAGKVSSLFGSVADRVSDSIIKQIKKSRATADKPPAVEKKSDDKKGEKPPAPPRKRIVKEAAEEVESAAPAARKRAVTRDAEKVETAAAPARKRTADDDE